MRGASVLHYWKTGIFHFKDLNHLPPSWEEICLRGDGLWPILVPWWNLGLWLWSYLGGSRRKKLTRARAKITEGGRILSCSNPRRANSPLSHLTEGNWIGRGCPEEGCLSLSWDRKRHSETGFWFRAFSEVKVHSPCSGRNSCLVTLEHHFHDWCSVCLTSWPLSQLWPQAETTESTVLVGPRKKEVCLTAEHGLWREAGWLGGIIALSEKNYLGQIHYQGFFRKGKSGQGRPFRLVCLNYVRGL